MIETISGALLIMIMRICDVSIGTIRTIMVVQGRKYLAGMTGFFEVLIWVFAIRFVMQHLDNIANLFGYAGGFGLGNIIGITIEQKIGLGFVQMNIISKYFTDKIAATLRKSKYGVTILPAEGGSGGISIIVIITPRKVQKKIIALIEKIDAEAFITVQHSLPYRGFMHGARK
ncbi:MAG: hypothetical protein AUK34_13195 [Ignavibacteria bacterium CG2_30_36_16]|nr:DUF2179 domain-containing protein [Ignavibacteria bacterium]OIP55480.1 MAG: hypothetical protein AUK34_13195 [Ignavibacteria bacterium CG2_30_36_16]